MVIPFPQTRRSLFQTPTGIPVEGYVAKAEELDVRCKIIAAPPQRHPHVFQNDDDTVGGADNSGYANY